MYPVDRYSCRISKASSLVHSNASQMNRVARRVQTEIRSSGKLASLLGLLLLASSKRAPNPKVTALRLMVAPAPVLVVFSSVVSRKILLS